MTFKTASSENVPLVAILGIQLYAGCKRAYSLQHFHEASYCLKAGQVSHRRPRLIMFVIMHGHACASISRYVFIRSTLATWIPRTAP